MIKWFASSVRSKVHLLLLMMLSIIASVLWSRRGSRSRPPPSSRPEEERNTANTGVVRSHHRIAAMIFASPSVRRAILNRVIFVLQDGNTGEAMLLTLPFNRILRRRLEMMARRWLEAAEGTISRQSVNDDLPPKNQQRQTRFYTNPLWRPRQT
ncbi:hypothetical protein THRCLA_08981 [Thraustotheca clavata]|uniref:Uncharacterized protein n=1 Tax=Thraustotheca clavata TaxID=74557 RepID=A0A1V9Z0J7_9STRA|nr:hypothetical protein THRCLA_08981 [Thraustotheca clavata]